METHTVSFSSEVSVYLTIPAVDADVLCLHVLLMEDAGGTRVLISILFIQ